MHEDIRGPDALGGWARPGDIRCGECKHRRELARRGQSIGMDVCTVNGPFVNDRGSTRFPQIEKHMTCGKAVRVRQAVPA